MLTVILMFSGCFSSKKDDSDSDSDNEIKIPTTGIELDKKAEQMLKKLDSYTESLSLTAVMTLNDIDFSVVSTSVNQVMDQQTDKYSSMTETSITTTYDSEIITLDITDGFQDGYMYRNCYVNINQSKIKSPISKKDFLAFQDDLTEKEEKELGNPTPNTSQLEHLEEGGYKAILKDFNKEFINNFFKSMVGEDLQLDTEINALTVTITTTEDYVYKSIVLDFELNNPDDAKNTIDSISISCDYSDINSTVINKYDISDYTEVSDIRDIYKVEDAIEKAKESDHGKCTLTYDYENNRSPSTNVHQEHTLRFNNENGLSYNYTIVQGTLTQIVLYEKNKVSVKNYTEGNLTNETSANSTDDIQKNTVHSVIDFAGFNQYLISNIQLSKDEENTYVIELFSNDISDTSMADSRIIYELKITIVKGTLTKYCYKNTYKDSNSPKVETIATYDWSAK